MPSQPGLLNRIVTFQTNTGGIGVGGSVTYSWSDIDKLKRIPARYKPERGVDRIAAGRLQSSVMGVMWVYGCDALREVTAGDVVVIHDIGKDVSCVIKTITNPDNTGHEYELVIESGVSLG